MILNLSLCVCVCLKTLLFKFVILQEQRKNIVIFVMKHADVSKAFLPCVVYVLFLSHFCLTFPCHLLSYFALMNLR